MVLDKSGISIAPPKRTRAQVKSGPSVAVRSSTRLRVKEKSDESSESGENSGEESESGEESGEGGEDIEVDEVESPSAHVGFVGSVPAGLVDSGPAVDSG